MWNENCYLRFWLIVKRQYLCFCTCNAHNGKVCRGQDLQDGSLWVLGIRTLVEMPQREGCQAGGGRNVTIAAPSCVQQAHKLPERLSQRSVQIFAQVQQPESKGRLEPERLTALHHCPVTLLYWRVQRQIWSRGDGFVVCVEVSGEV